MRLNGWSAASKQRVTAVRVGRRVSLLMILLTGENRAALVVGGLFTVLNRVLHAFTTNFDLLLLCLEACAAFA